MQFVHSRWCWIVKSALEYWYLWWHPEPSICRQHYIISPSFNILDFTTLSAIMLERLSTFWWWDSHCIWHGIGHGNNTGLPWAWRWSNMNIVILGPVPMSRRLFCMSVFDWQLCEVYSVLYTDWWYISLSYHSKSIMTFGLIRCIGPRSLTFITISTRRFSDNVGVDI